MTNDLPELRQKEGSGRAYIDNHTSDPDTRGRLSALENTVRPPLPDAPPSLHAWHDLTAFIRRQFENSDDCDYYGLTTSARHYANRPIKGRPACYWQPGSSEGFYTHVDITDPEGVRIAIIIGKFWTVEAAELATRLANRAIYNES